MRRKKKEIGTTIYKVLLLRILLVYVLYSIMRGLFVWLNLNMFPNLDFGEFVQFMAAGLIFDTSAIFYTNILVILMHILPFKFRYNAVYQSIIKWVFWIINTIAIVLNMSDIVYYRFTLKRTTTAVFEEFKNENAIHFIRFIWDYWYITVLVVVLVVVMVVFYRKIKLTKPTFAVWYVYYPVSIALMLFTGLFCLAGMRGGISRAVRPITLSNASAYVSRAQYRAIVLNTPFALIRTFGKSVLHEKEYFTKERIAQLFSAEKQIVPDSTLTKFGSLKGRNVVVIIWESFAREWVGALNKDIAEYNGFTPFIDALLPESYVFANAYANGHKSIDAIPSVIAGIPSGKNPFVLSHYSGNKINSLASILNSQGYYSAFFHGAENGSMGFEAFTRQAGYKDYFGRTEYNNDADFDGNWGIWDEPFLQFMAKKMNDFKQPFITTVFTLSSHHPYKIPEKYEGHFPKGKLPIHQGIGYTDNALQQFFKTVSRSAWYENTLFVIVADHSATGVLKKYSTDIGRYAIPIIFYAPNSKLTGHYDNTVAQQIDILPSILDLLGYDKKFISFGSDLFSPKEKHFSFTVQGGMYQILYENWALQFDEEKTVGLYNLKDDIYMRQNLVGKYPEMQLFLENHIKAFIQEYNHRMLKDKLAI